VTARKTRAVAVAAPVWGWLARAAADSPHTIPSAEELGSNEAIVNYRESFQPTVFESAWTAWAGWPWLDVVVLVALLMAGAVMVWRHVHFRWFWLPAALTLAYFGVLRGGCVCPVGSVAGISVGVVHPQLVAVSTAVLFLAPLVMALFMGRIFCVAGCPLGAMQQLVSRKSVRLPARLERGLRLLPVLALAATVWLAIRSAFLLVCLLDPYKTAFFWAYGWLQRGVVWLESGFAEPRWWFWVGDWTAWGALLGALALGLWVHRPFCRFVCPYGVLLGMFAAVACKRRHIEQTRCVQCGVCEKRCPVGAITRHPGTGEFRVSAFHCIQCNRCSSYCRKDGIG
jgi:polyferredoxin